jgi:hypothetical protein
MVTPVLRTEEGGGGGEEDKGRGAWGTAAWPFSTGTRRWGTGDGVVPCSRRGPRERGRVGGCPARPAAAQGRRAWVVWRGHAVRPVRTVEGEGLTDGDPAQWRAAAVELF